jgi:hypothetical protein
VERQPGAPYLYTDCRGGVGAWPLLPHQPHPGAHIKMVGERVIFGSAFGFGLI